MKTGAKVNAPDVSGRQPLYYALSGGHGAMAAYLRRHGAVDHTDSRQPA